MPLRFTRRVSLIPGLRVNFSKSDASLSIGHWGCLVHRRATRQGGERRAARHWPVLHAVHPARGTRQTSHRLAFAILVVAGLVVIYWAALAQH